MACLIVLTACQPSLDTAACARLSRGVQPLFATGPAERSVDASDRPPSVRAQDPERVYLTRDGLYIATGSSFASERGFFVPRVRAFGATSGGDPEYRPLCDGVFVYEIRG